jgi:ankyrin repeat protein
VKELIINGADVNVRNNRGNTPLHDAVYNEHIDVVRELLNNDAYIDDENDKGQTPLDIALKKDYTEIVKLLEEFNQVDIKEPEFD